MAHVSDLKADSAPSANHEGSPELRPRPDRPVRIIASVVTLAILGALSYLAWPWLSLFNRPNDIRDLVSSAGAWGPLVFIALQMIQVLIAPIPGQVTGLVGGLLFGTALGVLYTTIGATIGFTLIFVLSRRLGRPFVEKFVGERTLERLDYLSGRTGALLLFVIYLLPAFPDDVISFAAGLTRIPLQILIAVSLAGRLPGYLVLSAAGNGLTYQNLNPIIVIGALMILLGAVAYWKRGLLHEMVASGNVFRFIRSNWALSPARTVLLIVGLGAAGVLAFFLATADPLIELPPR